MRWEMNYYYTHKRCANNKWHSIWDVGGNDMEWMKHEKIKSKTKKMKPKSILNGRFYKVYRPAVLSNCGDVFMYRWKKIIDSNWTIEIWKICGEATVTHGFYFTIKT